MLAKNSRTPLGVRFPALSFTTIASKLAPTGLKIVPTLCVGMPPWTLRVLPPMQVVTRSVTGCIPTQSVGTISVGTKTHLR